MYVRAPSRLRPMLLSRHWDRHVDPISPRARPFDLLRRSASRMADPENPPSDAVATDGYKSAATSEQTSEEQETDLVGRCYCGVVNFAVKADATVHFAAFCHCESCRRAHAAPLYQVCYVSAEDFLITAGAASLSECRFVSDPAKGSRSFCIKCGTRICNIMADGRLGFFPNTLDREVLNTLPERFQPTFHFCPEEKVIILPEDGLHMLPNPRLYS